MTIQEKIAAQIAGSNEVIANAVVEKMAAVEISKRIEILHKGIEKQDSLKKELNKINRDDITEYVAGEPTTKMSEARFKEIKKLKESLEKLTKAIDTALVTNTSENYTKIADAIK